MSIGVERLAVLIRATDNKTALLVARRYKKYEVHSVILAAGKGSTPGKVIISWMVPELCLALAAAQLVPRSMASVVGHLPH